VYSLRILQPAAKELEKIDQSTAEHIADRIQWLSENLDSTKLYPLKGELKGLYKIREGSYRIIFEILKNERTIIIHSVGHRREIYKRW
jgi:mRNA interferase RelE/StbE